MIAKPDWSSPIKVEHRGSQIAINESDRKPNHSVMSIGENYIVSDKQLLEAWL